MDCGKLAGHVIRVGKRTVSCKYFLREFLRLESKDSRRVRARRF